MTSRSSAPAVAQGAPSRNSSTTSSVSSLSMNRDIARQRAARRREEILRQPFHSEAEEQLFHTTLQDWLVVGNRSRSYGAAFAVSVPRVVHLIDYHRIPPQAVLGPSERDKEDDDTSDAVATMRQDNVWSSSGGSRHFLPPEPLSHTTLDCSPLQLCCTLPYSMSDPVLQRVFLSRTSVVEMATDAIVVAANEFLLGGGGVDGAVHQAAGPLLLRECASIGGCAPGQSVVTKGYLLPARAIIHTVAPRNQDESLLRSCYRTVFQVAKERNIQTIAFCCIGTGRFGYPMKEGTQIALEETLRELRSRIHFGGSVDHGESTANFFVSFSCYSAQELEVYRSVLPEVYLHVMSSRD